MKPSVSTSGEAVIYVVPDEVAISFGVETFDPNLDKARAANDEAAGRIVKAILTAGVQEKHLQTDQLQIELRYRNGSHPVQGVEGYVARRSYTAVLKDVKLLDKAIDAVLKNGANHFHGLDFRTTELRKHRDEARRMAIKAAKEKATLLAGELGVQVGGPRTISEGAVYSGYFGGRYRNYNYMAQNAMQVAPGGGDGGGENNPLGQIAVRATVSVTFDLK